MVRPVYRRIQSAKGVYPDPHIKRTQDRKRVWAGMRKEDVQDVLYTVGRAWRQARASGSICGEGDMEGGTQEATPFAMGGA